MEGVVVLAGVAEEPVVGVQHLLREEVEPLPGHPAVVQSFLAAELDHEALAQVLGSKLHYAPVRFLNKSS